MAEERISIHRCSNKCRFLREVKEGYSIVNGLSAGTYCTAYIHGQWQKIDPEKDCKDCKRAEYNGIPRTEAIERMAKALYDKYEVRCNSDDCPPNDGTTCEGCQIWEIYEEVAEAALDALVGK